MAVNLAELLALPSEQRLKLAEVLLESAVPEDIALMLRDLVTRLERTSRVIDQLHGRFGRLDETLLRNRAEVREAVLREHTIRPFQLTPR
jgi:hypothetical protein